jgi:hypothetical protein
MTDAQRQILQTYEHWRSLSVAEGQAIHACDWSAVEKCQATKTKLQAKIVAASEALRLRAPRFAEAPCVIDRRIRDIVGELLVLERENESAISAQYRRARQEQAELAHTSRTLRQVHRAYTPAGLARWESYS